MIMGPSHVPSDHHSTLQGQNIYNDPTYEHLFPRADQFAGAPSWDQFNQSHAAALVPQQTSAAQSWHHSPLPQPSYNSSSQQSYGNPNQSYQTASPYQYGQFGNNGNNQYSHAHNSNGHNGHAPSQGPVGAYTHSPAVDPSLGLDPNALRQQQQSPYQIVRNSTPQGQPTVTPQVLQQNGIPQQAPRPTASPFQVPKTPNEMFAQRPTPTPLAVAPPPTNPNYEVPTGKVTGGYYIIDEVALAKATKSNALNKFVNFGTESLHLASNRTALPVYNARQSIKELKKASAGNKKILDRLAKKPSSARPKSKSSTALGKVAAGSPSALKKELSDSESYTESSDDSDYSSDEEDEPSPLPVTRPDEPHQAVRYDVIKASWHPRRSQPDSAKIKASLRDLWEVLNTIQKRWRADSKAVTEAEEQKKSGELPVLKSRVASQRDLLQTAFKAALEFSHPDVLYHLGQVKPFSYLCYQFLANRFKAQDYDGGLSAVIYQVLVRTAGMLTNELLEETKLIKALISMKKNANEANKAMIQKVIESAAASSKKQKVSSPPRTTVSDAKGAKNPAPQSAVRPSTDVSAAKKVKAPAPAAVGVTKKGTTPTNVTKAGPTVSSTTQKRPGEKPAVLPVKVKANPVANKPSSTFFSSLNATSKKTTAPVTTATNTKPNAQQKPAAQVSKEKKPAPAASKPAFSFAETMAQLLKPKEETTAPTKPEKQLPPETPEEKAKRLRKESRRHLRVTFRPDASLVNIRYFHHDPEEEQGHDENFVRDAGDIGGEGRMFKQHRDMADDDDDDDEPELDYRSWIEPTAVDFALVPAEERERNYEPYGGGVKKTVSPERDANQRREQVTLMEFYTRPDDIPPSPREPTEDNPKADSTPIREFGPPPQSILDRAPAPIPALPDISNLESIVRQLAGTAPQPNANHNVYMPPQPAPAAAPAAPAAPPVDLGAILSSLQSQQQQQQQHAPVSLPPALAQIPAPPMPPVPGFDLASLMSAIQGSANGGAFPPLPAGMPQFPQAFQQQPPQMGGDHQMQQQQQQQQTLQNQHTNGGTKRQRDEGNGHNVDRGHAAFKKQKGGKHNNDRPAYKVIPCRFFKQGNCTKGDDCTFIHDRN